MHNKDPCLYIQDILEAIANREEYMEGLTFEEFKKDRKTADARHT